MEKSIKSMKKYITPHNILLGILLVVLIYQFMNIAPFCTLDSNQGPYIQIQQLASLISNPEGVVRSVLINNCDRCRSIEDPDECEASSLCTYINNGDESTIRRINIGHLPGSDIDEFYTCHNSGPNPVNPVNPVNLDKPRDQHHEEYSHHDDGYHPPNCTGPDCL